MSGNLSYWNSRFLRGLLTELWDPDYTEEGDYILVDADESDKEAELE